MTIKRLGTSNWEVRVSAGGTYRRTQYRRRVIGSKEDAKRVEALLQLKAGKISESAATITLDGFIFCRWLPSIDVSECTRSGYRRHMKKLCSNLGHLKLSEISPQHLELYFNARGSAGMARKEYETLRIVMNTAVRWQLLDVSPCSRMQPPRKPRTSPPKVYSAEQVRLIMSEVQGQWFEPLWLLGVFCGLRPEESTGLDVPPRNWDGTLQIERAYSNQGDDGWQLTETKTEAANALVYVPAEVVERILKITKGKKGPIARPDRSPHGYRPNREVFAKAYRTFCIKNGLPHLPPKNLRHTAATLMLASGVDLPVVSKVLRHTMISTTANAYLGTVEGAKKSATESLMDSIK